MTLSIYTNGVIRTIERRFSLSSFQTGMLNSSNDIIHICIVGFIGYFSRKYHKPRIMCATVMFSSIAGFMMASPHFISFREDHQTRLHLLNDNKMKRLKYCSKSQNVSNSLSDSNCANTRRHPAFYIFLAAQLISGIGSSGIFTLTLAYIDENAPKHRASLLIGVYMGMISFGPVFGLGLSTLCLKLPENLFSTEEMIDPNDPTYIGCWWLGYLIAASLLAFFAVFMWFFPKKINEDKNSPADNPDFSKQIKGDECILYFLLLILVYFPKALKKLVTNKLYILNLCQIICNAYTIYGMYVNLVRYIETHFNYPAYIGSIVAGHLLSVVSAVVGSVGGFLGGVLTSRLRLKMVGALKMILTCSALFMCGITILLNLSCPQVDMDMTIGKTVAENHVINSCNVACDCTTRRNDYYPVCFNNSINYFSPCIAGCQGQANGTFTSCKCLRNSFLHNETSTITDPFFTGTTKPGYCIPKCGMLIPFAVTLFFMSFISTVTRVPGVMTTFRLVDDEERPFALGMNSFGVNLLGFIPAPLIVGKLIDHCCKLWQVTCSVTGACLLFDTSRLRKTLYGFTLVVEVINFSFFFALFMFVRKLPIGQLELTERRVNLEMTVTKEKDREDKNLNSENVPGDDGLKFNESKAENGEVL
ncbi:hypothetical protein HELRODRAFT_112693 [Helobdella robusta]|uniref:Solute carrier organic anion transporter family member n=1 Tax=Helobdella robusta TaxID=6412 RepID=T1EFL4_HELRO|nr:hypothetical protein HELRODRAFT_112693 [Helobdella robusta]ESO01244.1 hypothetical protein HELRODRAFT_112693 [Helobdella robusta]